VQPDVFPFSIPAFRNGIDLPISNTVTFFVGENGSGKSTLLEAIAEKCGFPRGGGGKNHTYDADAELSPLASAIRLSWAKKPLRGFFLRAESLFNFATYIDKLADEDEGILQAYGGRSLHEQSHGESFLSLFSSRFDSGFYILDEPEAALSPQRQLALLRILFDLERSGAAQFLIATHSPLLFSYPGAGVVECSDSGLQYVDYRKTEHYLLTRHYLESPERYFRHLFADPE
jgi:predicted ATPase